MTIREIARLATARALVEELRDAHAATTPGGNVELLETHISWVLLIGDDAYKIKKPLDLGFLNFRQLERRRHFCEEEVRLNRQWAPSLYLGVCPVTRHAGRVRIGGDGTALEYAVHMRRFDQDRLLDAELSAGHLAPRDLRRLAERVAQWHRSAPTPATEQRSVLLRRTAELVVENFPPIERALTSRSTDPEGTNGGATSLGEAKRKSDASLATLQAWTQQQLEQLENRLGDRFDNGFFRECHGDLHLRNLVRLDDGITAFDCIEFDPELRNIDVVADYSFLHMDLVERNETELAAVFVNRYLEVSGDYDGLSVFNLFFVYRCLVRAKIAAFRGLGRQQDAERRHDYDEAHRYIDIASRQCAPRTPLIVAMHGLTGAGKTVVAGELMTALPAIRLRSDLERKRIVGLAETASSRSGIGSNLYTDTMNDRVYQCLLERTKTIVCAGHDVIIDAAFLERRRRDAASDLARAIGARFALVTVTASEQELRQRLAQRKKDGQDASEGTVDVLDYQRGNLDEIADDERYARVECQTNRLDLAKLVQTLVHDR